MKLSYKIRLILVLSFTLLVTILLISFFNYQSARRSIREAIVTTSLPLTRENIYSEILKDLIPSISIASLMANDAFLIEWISSGETEVDKLTRYLKHIQETYGLFSTFFVSENSRNYYHFSGILKQISPDDEHDVWYFNFVSGGKPYELDVDSDQASEDKLTIFINFRLDDYSGHLLGVTGVGIKMENFTRFLTEKEEEYQRRIYFVNKDGVVQAHSDRSLIEKASIFSLPGISEIAEELLIPGEVPVNGSFSAGKREVHITSRYMPEIDWFLLVEQDEGGSLTSARTNLHRTLLGGFIASLIIIAISAFTVNFFQSKIELMAATDELTKVANRREFERQYGNAVYRTERYQSPFSLILLDVDHFKEINDTEGHLVGDKLLTELTELVKKNIRPTDVLARWGGDEFIVLTECELDAAFHTAERLRIEVAKSLPKALGYSARKLSISCGVAQYTPGDSSESLTLRADKALYLSKQGGRNRVSTL